jgi:hypothetical protein
MPNVQSQHLVEVMRVLPRKWCECRRGSNVTIPDPQSQHTVIYGFGNAGPCTRYGIASSGRARGWEERGLEVVED